MTSTSDIPQNHSERVEPEDEPLLGRPGDASQKPDDNILRNLVTGTASVAQVGIWMLAALVWSGILSQPLSLFTAHPLLSISAVFLQVQSSLILQPTVTQRQKTRGARLHAAIQLISTLLFVSGFITIEVKKGSSARLISPHGILGLTTYISVVLQALAGVVQFFFPLAILGSVDAGKRIYKYHRWTGYVLLLLEMATVVAATQTTYNLIAIHISLGPVVVAAILTLAGVGARIKKQKLGIGLV